MIEAPSMNKDYNLLQLLVILHQTRQTVAAAKKLNISQPTVSIMLKKLREQFGDELFVRNKNQLEPTEKCEALVEKIPALLDQIDELYTDDKQWHISQMQGEITLMLPSTLMAPLAAPLLATLTAQAPKLTVSCHPWSDRSIHSLEHNRGYWGVSYLPMETNKNVVQKPLPDDRFMLVTRADHPLKTSQLADVLDYPLCVSVIPGYIEASKVEMLLKKYKIDKKISVRCSDSSLMLELICQSNCIGVMSEKNRPLLDQRLRALPLPSELYKDTFRREAALCCHLRDRHAPFTQWLFDHITAIMEKNGR